MGPENSLVVTAACANAKPRQTLFLSEMEPGARGYLLRYSRCSVVGILLRHFNPLSSRATEGGNQVPWRSGPGMAVTLNSMAPRCASGRHPCKWWEDSFSLFSVKITWFPTIRRKAIVCCISGCHPGRYSLFEFYCAVGVLCSTQSPGGHLSNVELTMGCILSALHVELLGLLGICC